jgi:hypothetical protein
MTEDRAPAETKAMEQLVSRLKEAFSPQVSDREIGERVEEVYSRFDGSKIREFVPLLVENAVRRELIAGLRAGPGTDATIDATTGTGTDAAQPAQAAA